ncbi:MAG: LuxR C-terminal-related transcriptional regulator [Caldilineaceae bacterium]
MNEPLSEREIEILELIAEGSANAEIAAKLSLSLNTVKWYSRRIYEKLAVENRTQAIQRARSLGMLNGGSQPTQPTIQPHSNLPSALTTLVGRRAEIDTVKQLLRQHRLVTLTGPGGIGKTRLALSVAEEMAGIFRDGVYFVDLAAISEASLVINTIADILGVAESLDTPLLVLTQAALRNKQILLVLDNFEHLIEAAPLVADLLAAAHELKILITSREVLALYGEQEYAVPPLQLPDLEWFAIHRLPSDELLRSEALQLFERCAQAISPTFRLSSENAAAVASICLRLDGLPLAIELAAAYSKLLTPQAMLTQLDSYWLEMKRPLRNLPTRQQTLRNTIEWSYRFLSEEERQLFAQLSVFRGGCTLEAIDAICKRQLSGLLIEQLNGLVNKSLVWRREGRNGEPRFGMLETIREYAQQCLSEQGDLEAVQERHARYYTKLAAYLESLSIKQRVVMNQFESENDNFRVALRWSLTHDPEPGLNLIGDLGSCWRIRGRLAEGMNWAQQLLSVGQQAPLAARARAYASAGAIAYVLGHRSESRQLADQSWALAQQVLDPPTRAQALFVRAVVQVAPYLTAAEYEEIVEMTQEAGRLFVALGSRMNYARTFNVLGEVKRMQQRYTEAIADYEVSLQGLRSVDYQSGVSIALSNLGWAVYHLDNDKAALAHFTESVNLAYDLEFTDGVGVALIGVAGVLARQHQPQPAAKLLGTSDALREALGKAIPPCDEPDYLRTQATLKAQLGEVDFARTWQTGRLLSVDDATAFVNEFARR